VTRLWARTPLRVKLVATLLALVVAALGAAGLAATAALRSYLVERVDAQLRQQPFGDGDGPGPGGGPRGGGARDPRFRNQYYVRYADASGAETGVITPDTTTDTPRLPVVTYADAVARHGHAFTVPARTGSVSWRALALPSRDGGVVTVARDLGEVEHTVGRLVFLQLGIGTVVLVLLGAAGFFLVRNSLRPLVEVEATAGAIAAGDLSRRVPEGDPRTEVGRLAAALNTMLHQVESAFREREVSEAAARRSEQRMRRFVGDASHELRTPLTSIRGFAELYRQGAAGPDDVPRLMRRIEDEGARMGLLVDDLLLLARLDEERPLARDDVDLVRLAADAVHDARALDPARPVLLDAGDGPLVVLGDEARLRQVLGNLVGNALKYTPTDTPVELRLRADGTDAVVDVVDHGQGLGDDEAARVFERFYRADPARTHAEGGAGLGLAIVAAVAGAHGGSVGVAATPGGGATFTVRLPLALSR
jgi:two-component system OmpR family sensor kinase